MSYVLNSSVHLLTRLYSMAKNRNKNMYLLTGIYGKLVRKLYHCTLSQGINDCATPISADIEPTDEFCPL